MNLTALFVASMVSAGVRASEADLIAVTVDDAVDAGWLPRTVRALPAPPETLAGLVAELESAGAGAVRPGSQAEYVASLTAQRDRLVLNTLAGAR